MSRLLLLLALVQLASAFQAALAPSARASAPKMSLEGWEARLLPDDMAPFSQDSKGAMRGTPMPWKLKAKHTRTTRTVDLDDDWLPTPQASRVSMLSQILENLGGK